MRSPALSNSCCFAWASASNLSILAWACSASAWATAVSSAISFSDFSFASWAAVLACSNSVAVAAKISLSSSILVWASSSAA